MMARRWADEAETDSRPAHSASKCIPQAVPFPPPNSYPRGCCAPLIWVPLPNPWSDSGGTHVTVLVP